jgi:hypothetical protein
LVSSSNSQGRSISAPRWAKNLWRREFGTWRKKLLGE